MLDPVIVTIFRLPGAWPPGCSLGGTKSLLFPEYGQIRASKEPSIQPLMAPLAVTSTSYLRFDPSAWPRLCYR